MRMKDDALYVDVNLVPVSVREHVMLTNAHSPSCWIIGQIIRPHRPTTHQHQQQQCVIFIIIIIIYLSIVYVKPLLKLVGK